MNEPEEFALTPAEEAFFRRFFQHLALRYMAFACIAASLLWLGGFLLLSAFEPMEPGVEEVEPVSPLPSEPEPSVDIRAELERVAGELAAQQSRGGNQKARDALRRAEQLAKELDAALERLAALEAKIEVSPPPAAPAATPPDPGLAKELDAALQRLAALEAKIEVSPPPAAPAVEPAAAPPDLSGVRERLYNLESRQDHLEGAQTRDTRSVLERVGNLERFRHELEQRRDEAEMRILDRLYAIEERLSELE